MLPVSDTEKLVHAFMTSRLDYCNALLCGCSASSINKLQVVQNAAARVLTSRDGYRLHFIDTDTNIDTAYRYRYCYRYYLEQKDMMWKVVENFKLFYYCWTLETVLKFFNQEQGVIFLFVFYFIKI